MRPAAGSVRLVRSFAVGLVCTLTAAIAHVVAGGMISAAAVGILFAGTTAIVWFVSIRRLTCGQMVGLLVLSQLFMHLGFSTGTMQMTVSMLATHVVATTVSALALSLGEKFVWLLAERLGVRLYPQDTYFIPIPRSTALIPVATKRSRQDVRLAYSRSLRGPPTVSS